MVHPPRLQRSVAGLTRLGVSVLGSRVLEVKGRKSGLPRRNPVNLLTLDGPAVPRRPPRRGRVGPQRPSGRRPPDAALGSRRDERTATEIADADKAPVLRAYLRRWKAEVGMFFEGVGPDSTDEELAAIAPATRCSRSARPRSKRLDQGVRPDRPGVARSATALTGNPTARAAAR